MPARKDIHYLTFTLLLSLWCFNMYGVDNNVATTTISLDVPEVSLLRTNSSIISLELSHREAGMSIEYSKSDSASRLLISSIITSAPRAVSARITFGSVPAGTNLLLSAISPNSNFVGTYGNLSSPVVLDATDKTIVSGIGTCYSGTGSDDGYILRYTLSLDQNPQLYGLLRATTSAQITVTLTLTAAQ